MSETLHTVETLAYAAGFIDGEGCIFINKVLQRKGVSPSHSLQVSVSSTDEASIKWMQETFGGYAKSRIGQPSMTRDGWRPAWEWSIHMNRAQQFLALILPYLKIKHHQACVAIGFQEYLLTFPLHNLKDEEKQVIIARREAYRQHINSFHGSKRQWVRSEEFPVTGVPCADDPCVILPYTAGLIDGEGCIRISVKMPTGEYGKGKLRAPSHCLRIKLANTDTFIIEWLHATFNGSIVRNVNGKGVATKGCTPAHEWILLGENAKTFLEKIEPYMKGKREQAKVAIEFQTYNKEHSRHIIANQTQEVVDRKEEYRQLLNSMNSIRKPVASIYA